MGLDLKSVGVKSRLVGTVAAGGVGGGSNIFEVRLYRFLVGLTGVDSSARSDGWNSLEGSATEADSARFEETGARTKFSQFDGILMADGNESSDFKRSGHEVDNSDCCLRELASS